MAEFSFDIVCKLDQQELANSIELAKKELAHRFDFKGSHFKIQLQAESILLEGADDLKMKQLIDVLQTKMVRRRLDLKAFIFGSFESNVSGLVKCEAKIQNGLDQEQCKKITKLIKDSKYKVQARIQGDAVRVSGKSKDELQAVQQMVQEADFDFAAIFDNYR